MNQLLPEPSQLAAVSPSGTLPRYMPKGPGWKTAMSDWKPTVSPAVTLYVDVPEPESAPTLQRRSVLVTSSTGLLLFVFWRTYSYASVTVPSGAMNEVKR